MTTTRGVRVFGVLAAVLAAAAPGVGECLPSSGTFTGYYRADRWGGHTFAGFLTVEPKARASFEEFRDRLVTADVEQIAQPINPGDGFVQKVGKVTPVKDAPVEIKLAWAGGAKGVPLYRRIRPGDDFTFTVTVTNKLDRAFGPATIRADGFFLAGVGGANLPTEDVEWDAADLRGGGTPSNEWKESRLALGAGKSATWTVSVKKARAGEFEFHVYFVECRDGKPEYLRVESNRLRLDAVDDKPKPAAGLVVTLTPDANPPRPPRPIPARLVFKNTNDRPLNFYLPHRGDKFAADQVLRCFDPSGTMILGAREPGSADEVFGRRDVEQKPQRLAAGESLSLDVTLPDRTALAAAQFRGTFLLDKSLRKAGELYFDTAGPAVSGYAVIRR
jgi:hypothetical protein